ERPLGVQVRGVLRQDRADELVQRLVSGFPGRPAIRRQQLAVDPADEGACHSFGMRIFLDTADLEEIREVARWGILSGVTTNPTLMSRTSGMSHEDVIKEIAGIVDGPISAETISLEADGMLEEGRRFAKWHPNVVVKVPS